ncbi:MAG: phage terminase large subunit, partial [Geminicoccaceae bacterium]|nr:phage terminase large subunit [Geminicoccaceae bacterium]
MQFVTRWNRSQGRKTPRLHLEICQWLDECWRANDRRILLLVFRNSGKSTLAALYCAWLLRGNPELRILVLSAEHALATKMTRNVRGVLERHPATEGLLDTRPECWAADQLIVKRRRISRDPSLLARGLGGNITGCRADVIVCDDVEVPNTADTEEKRRLLRERLRELSFILVPGGLQLYIGTPHSHHSIYSEIPRRELNESEPFLAGFRRLTLPLVRSTGEQRWKERFPDTVVDRLLAEAGPAKFRSQLQLLPTRPEDVRLDPDRLVPYDAPAAIVPVQGRDELWIGGRRMISAAAAWDPAYGRPERGDSSVVAAVFVDAEGHYWLHAIEYLVLLPGTDPEVDDATKHCRAVVRFVERNHLPSIAVETNGIGGFLPALLRHELRRAGVGATVIQRTSSVAKDRRILEAFDPLLPRAFSVYHADREAGCLAILYRAVGRGTRSLAALEAVVDRRVNDVAAQADSALHGLHIGPVGGVIRVAQVGTQADGRNPQPLGLAEVALGDPAREAGDIAGGAFRRGVGRQGYLSCKAATPGS